VKDLEKELAEAEARLARLPRMRQIPNDPAYVNLKDHLKNLDAEIAKGKAIYEAEKDIRGIELCMAYRERVKPVPFTDEELKAARAVRTINGWHKVVRVNAKTVTVETGYSWTDRYPFKKILEVATLEKETK
jgi:hypothetical protein